MSEEAEAPEPSLSETIAQALDAATEAVEAEGVTPGETEVPLGAAQEETTPVPPPEEDTEISDQKVPAEQSKPETLGEELRAIDPPAGWSKDDKATFKDLPRNQQEAVVDNAKNFQRDYTRKTEELARAKRVYGEIEDAVAPYKQRLELQGISPATLVKQLLGAQDFLERDPIQGAKWLLESIGVTPDQLVNSEGQDGHPVDPRIAQLNNQVQNLQGYLQNQDNVQKQHTQQGLTAEVQQFAETKEADGSLRYPHFEALSNEVVPFIQQLKATTNLSNHDILQQAYDKAVFSNPETRKIVLAAEKAKEQAQALVDKQAKVKAAKQAGGSIKGSPAPNVANVPSNDLRSIIEAAFEGTT